MKLAIIIIAAIVYCLGVVYSAARTRGAVTFLWPFKPRKVYRRGR